MSALVRLHELRTKGPQSAYERLRNRAALEHRGLAVSRAKRFLCAGADLEDLIQEGMIGLLEAIDHFDPRDSADVRKRFGAYAVPFIDGAILRARPRNTLGRLSIGEYAVRYADAQARKESRAFGRETETAPDQTEDTSRKHRPETAAALRAYHWRLSSLDAPAPGQDEALSAHEKLAAIEEQDPEQAYQEKERLALLAETMAELDPSEARLVRWRYGVCTPTRHDVMAAPECSPEDIVALVEMRTVVRKMLGEINTEERRLLCWRFGIPEGDVHVGPQADTERPERRTKAGKGRGQRL